MNAFEAHWFIYNHPNCIQVDPEHPLVDINEYEFEGFGPDKFLSREGKPKDAEYYRAIRERAYFGIHLGQFIYNIDWSYHFKEGKIEVWLETGQAYFQKETGRYESNMHDIRLDSSGETFEEALIQLANKIKDIFGD